MLETPSRCAQGAHGLDIQVADARRVDDAQALPQRDRVVGSFVHRRVHQLQAGREQPGFLAVVLAAKRIANITRGTEAAPLRADRLAPGVESELGRASEELAAGLDADLAAGDYGRSLQRISRLADLLERFFVEVLVMDPDPEIRANRLALLRGLGEQLARVAVLTEMVVEKGESRSA